MLGDQGVVIFCTFLKMFFYRVQNAEIVRSCFKMRLKRLTTGGGLLENGGIAFVFKYYNYLFNKHYHNKEITYPLYSA